MSKKSFIDSVKVGSPCSEDWKDMKGNDRVRFCSHCAKSVNDLSTMTRKEATRLVRSSGGDLCIRYIVDPQTQRPMFAHQLLQITRRNPAFAAGVLSATVALSSQASAQNGTPAIIRDPILRTDRSSSPLARSNERPTSTLSGTVVDRNGAVIVGAKVEIVNIANNVSRNTLTNEEGIYRFDDLPEGNYKVDTTSPGFMLASQQVLVSGESKVADSSLEVGEIVETVEVLANVELQAGAVGGLVALVEYSSPLSVAIADEDVDSVRQLLKNGTDPNGKEPEYSKITPLFVAVENGNVDIVQMLLAYGARPNVRDSSKRTALSRLDEDATPELVGLLLRSGAKANLTDNDGNTVLIMVAGSVKPEVLQALVDGGANINHANNEGRTALMTAVDYGEIENVRTLLINGAFVNAKDSEGKTALDLTDDEGIEELLRTYGATGKEEKPDEK